MELEAAPPGIPELVEQLEATLTAGWPVPGTARRLVDGTRLAGLIDQIRLSIPEQVQAAQQVLARREQVLRAAQARAARMLEEAHHQYAQRLVDGAREGQAAAWAAEIEDQAWRRAEAIQQHADQAAARWLQCLHVHLQAVERVLAEPLPLLELADEPLSPLSPERRQPTHGSGIEERVPGTDASGALLARPKPEAA